MMSVNIEGERVPEDAGVGSLAGVSSHACELGRGGEVDTGFQALLRCSTQGAGVPY